MNGRIFLLAAAAVCGLGCSTTTESSTQVNLQLSGTFVGIQEGTNAGTAFSDEQIVFLLLHEGDSVTGTFDVTGLAGGAFRGSVDQNDIGFFIDFVLEQDTPCDATFAGRAEARTGLTVEGDVTVGVAGSYTGDDCTGTIAADFVVQRN